MNGKKSIDQWYIVCGATSGFGNALVHQLVRDDHKILAIARNEEELKNLQQQYPGHLDYIAGDLTGNNMLNVLQKKIEHRFIKGIFLNSGGPPAKSIEETTMEDWDQAYNGLLRWKVELTKILLPKFKEQQYGRILFSESASVKQPIENLVLSTSLRLAVVGYAKTLSEEYAHLGITVNILAPGYHDTKALNRLFEKKSKVQDISLEEARSQMIAQTKVGSIGQPKDMASLARWLLSDESKFVTGQTISVDGGVIKGIFG